AVVEIGPFIGAFGYAEAVIIGGFAMVGGQFAAKIAVDVFLGHDVGAPGRDAAGAIVDGAEYLGAGGVGIGLEPVMAGGGAGQFHFGFGGDAAVILAIPDHLPLAVDLFDFDDGAAMRGHFDIDLLLAERVQRQRALG